MDRTISYKYSIFLWQYQQAVMTHNYAAAGATIGAAMTFSRIPALDLAETCR